MARDLRGWHAGRPSSTATYLGLRAAHRATAGRSSQVARAVLARVPGSVDRVGRPRVQPSLARAVTELRRDGLGHLDPLLRPDEVASLVAFARRAPGRARLTDGSTVPASWGDRPDTAAAVSLDGTFAWARPEVQRLLADERLHAVVAAATGLRAVVHPPQLYWSFPTAGSGVAAAALAQRYHWDYDGLGGCRLHLYLTDVDEGTGPMEYVAGSHRPGTLGWHRPGSIDQVLDPAAVPDPSSVRTILGPAGTSFLSDPHGLHQATAPTRGERLFLVLPLQAGGYGGYYRRVRALPVRDQGLARRLEARDPSLRLFEAAPESARAAALVSR